MRAAAEEGPGEAPEDAAAERLLAGEAAEQRIDELDAEVAVEAAAFLRGRWLEHLRRDEVVDSLGRADHRRRIAEKEAIVN